jgi:hypothetical protein
MQHATSETLHCCINATSNLLRLGYMTRRRTTGGDVGVFGGSAMTLLIETLCC